MTEPVVKIVDIEFGRLSAPDLDKMEEFLVEFGMTRSARTPDTLYMRGTDPTHHIHVTHKGEPGFHSVAYRVGSEDDLKKLAKLPEAKSGVESIDEPGGGKRVKLRDPVNGFLVEAVYGIETPAPLQVTPRPLNWGADVLKHMGDTVRMQFGPSRVKRISHGVLPSPRLKETLAWFQNTFGLLTTDAFYAGDPSNMIGSFSRVDRGATPVDHHVLNVYNSPTPGLQHLSFEVQDIDDLFVGHNHLKKINKYEHMRGVGYHVPGGQVYDYWLDPWGQMHEHWMTTRRFTSTSKTNLMPAPKEHDPNSRFAQTIMADVGH